MWVWVCGFGEGRSGFPGGFLGWFGCFWFLSGLACGVWVWRFWWLVHRLLILGLLLGLRLWCLRVGLLSFPVL